jgi:hypothetical protein
MFNISKRTQINCRVRSCLAAGVDSQHAKIAAWVCYTHNQDPSTAAQATCAGKTHMSYDRRACAIVYNSRTHWITHSRCYDLNKPTAANHPAPTPKSNLAGTAAPAQQQLLLIFILLQPWHATASCHHLLLLQHQPRALLAAYHSRYRSCATVQKLWYRSCAKPWTHHTNILGQCWIRIQMPAVTAAVAAPAAAPGAPPAATVWQTLLMHSVHQQHSLQP